MWSAGHERDPDSATAASLSCVETNDRKDGGSSVGSGTFFLQNLGDPPRRMNRSDARPPIVRSKKLESPVQSAVAAFSAHTRAVIQAHGVSQLLSKTPPHRGMELQETAVLSVKREFSDSTRYAVGLQVRQNILDRVCQHDS